MNKGQVKLDFRGGRRPGSGRKKIGETRRISVTLPEEMWRTFDDVCERNNMKGGELVRESLKEYFFNVTEKGS